MTYACEECGFLFTRVSEVSSCPYCAGTRIRTATEEEQDALQVCLKNSGRWYIVQKSLDEGLVRIRCAV